MNSVAWVGWDFKLPLDWTRIVVNLFMQTARLIEIKALRMNLLQNLVLRVIVRRMSS